MSGELVWGDLQLDRDAPTATYELEALAGDGEDLDFGDPAAIEVALRSLLQDGSVVFSQGHENREVTIAVAVRGLTGDALAQAESALVQQLGRPGVNLVWRGSSVFSAPAVFEVVTSTLSYRYNANREHALSRRYVIRLVCLPWARSEELLVSTAPPVPRDNAGAPTAPTTVTINTASSLTGWTSGSGAVALVEGSTAVQAPGSVGADLFYTSATPVPVDATRYLLVDYKATGSAGTAYVQADGVTLRVESVTVSPFSGYQRITLRAPTKTFTRLRVVLPLNPQRPGGTLTVTNLARVTYPPAVGTDHQTVRRLPIKGTVRTQGSIRVEHETGALGVVMVYTWADDGSGYLPPLSPYRPGTPLAFPNTVSGSVDNLDTPSVFNVPAGAVPAGDYLILARLRFAAAATVSVVTTAETLIGGTVLDKAPGTSSTITTAVSGATTGHYVTLGAATLPTVRLATDKAATVRVTVALTNPATMDAELDEVWLFNTSIGSLTYVLGSGGTPTPGGPSRRMWIKPETVTEKPTILRGHAADGGDAFYASAGAGSRIESVGAHELRPPAMNVFTLTSGSRLASTSVEYYPRWHTHPVL